MNAARPQVLSLLFAAAAVASLICAIWHDIGARNSPSVERTATFMSVVDGRICQLPNTDIFLRLEDTPATDPFIQMLYYRANFAAYPHRVLMNDPQVPIDYRHDHPSTFHFNPTVQWLRDHHIAGQITLGVDGNGQFYCGARFIEPDGQ